MRLLEVELMPGESIEAEAGAMTYMTPNIRISTKIREESFLSALGLKILGGQSFFVNEYTASERPGRVALVFRSLRGHGPPQGISGEWLHHPEIGLCRVNASSRP
jgi:uncharacterized protein (AIM24 family)